MRDLFVISVDYGTWEVIPEIIFSPFLNTLCEFE